MPMAASVDMGQPVLEPSLVPFNGADLVPRPLGAAQQWPLQLGDEATVWIAPVSMGNPHAVQLVDDRSEEHTSELQSQSNLVCRLLLEKKKKKKTNSVRHLEIANTSEHRT